MSDSFDDFKTADGGEPADGLHTARLERASILDTRNGLRLKLDWRTVDMEHYWETWHGVSGRGKAFTQELVTALGVDFARLSSWEELGDELASREGRMYEVSVQRNGNFLNTTVEGEPQGVQEALPDLPADAADLPPAAAMVPGGGAAPGDAGIFGDDDIPF